MMIQSRAESLTRTLLAALGLCVTLGSLGLRGAQIHLGAWFAVAASAALGLVALGIAIHVAVKSANRSATSIKTVKDMASEEWFDHPGRLARFTVAQRLRQSIAVDRKLTEKEAGVLECARWVAFAFIISAVGTLGCVVWMRS
ncbi:MAG: hypothetical protein QM728_05095 [Gordonia sp. (in: high G+C Gram-positive bacteria)]|uniref:hypothetical protein n=1 Tax=Gordonia sp. (in: high G+C Gram-positive bacteria) TaxID=84139 RepID=UPI0039E4E5AF